MNSLVSWNPAKEMEQFENRLSRFFGRSPLLGNGDKELMTVAEWSPAVDIVEDDKEWLIKADLPDVRKEDAKVSVENGMLTITGERRLEKEEKGKKYHRIECAYGNFVRSFTLPEGTDGTKVSADFKDGVLKVHLPKGEKVRPKQIEIRTA